MRTLYVHVLIGRGVYKGAVFIGARSTELLDLRLVPLVDRRQVDERAHGVDQDLRVRPVAVDRRGSGGIFLKKNVTAGHAQGTKPVPVWPVQLWPCIVVALHSYGPIQLWPYIVMDYTVMALYSYGLYSYAVYSYGPI